MKKKKKDIPLLLKSVLIKNLMLSKYYDEQVLKYQKIDPRIICKQLVPIISSNEPNDVFKEKLDTFLDTPIDSEKKVYVLRLLFKEGAQLMKNFCNKTKL